MVIETKIEITKTLCNKDRNCID